jgi:dTDP-glucose pyrophosphorylase
MSADLNDLLTTPGTRIRQAMNQLEVTEKRILFVVDDDRKLLGTLTDGDIRRWILAEGNLDDTIVGVYNKNPYSVRLDYQADEIKKVMLEKKISCVPVVNESGQIAQLLFWDSIFDAATSDKPHRRVNLPVVVMAGGKGTRLDPFTKVLPKPLIPIGEKTVVEIIIESFLGYGVELFYLSLNYKSKIIKSYFEELNPPYRVEYIYETKPLGTAGSLRLLLGKLNDSFLVTNCDIIIRADYAELVDFHIEKKNDVTLVASLKNYHIPYGICEIENGGSLARIKEKPEYNFLVNTGMYVLQPSTLELIPDNEFFHITQLIEKVKKEGGRIGIFPISENAWIDTGQWAEYKNALKQFDLSI